MWDFKSLKHELSEAGFVDVARRHIGDDPVFADVEDAGRLVDAVAVGCTKPACC